MRRRVTCWAGRLPTRWSNSRGARAWRRLASAKWRRFRRTVNAMVLVTPTRRRKCAWAASMWAASILVAAILATQTAFALDPAKAITQYMQTSWTSESGLPQNSVQAIAQTADGYLWFGTQEGLTRFDGAHFSTYTRHNAHGLASSFIQALAAGRDGSLWIGTDSGLSHYQPTTPAGSDGVFTTLTTADGLSGNNIAAL